MKDATAAWLVKDDKAIIDGLALSVFDIAQSIERDPMAVVKRLREERPITLLAKAGFAFEFDEGSEEEAELLGLTLSGVPLGKALKWCAATDDRPSAGELAGYLKEGDLRPAMHQARDLGLWVSSADDLDTLRDLEETFPEEVTRAAIEDLLASFQPPTPSIVFQFARGELEHAEVVIGQTKQISRGKKLWGSTTKRTYRRKSSYGRSHSKRSYAKKRYSSSSKSKGKSAMYAHFG